MEIQGSLSTLNYMVDYVWINWYKIPQKSLVKRERWSTGFLEAKQLSGSLGRIKKEVLYILLIENEIKSMKIGPEAIWT